MPAVYLDRDTYSQFQSDAIDQQAKLTKESIDAAPPLPSTEAPTPPPEPAPTFQAPTPSDTLTQPVPRAVPGPPPLSDLMATAGLASGPSSPVDGAVPSAAGAAPTGGGPPPLENLLQMAGLSDTGVAGSSPQVAAAGAQAPPSGPPPLQNLLQMAGLADVGGAVSRGAQAVGGAVQDVASRAGAALSGGVSQFGLGLSTADAYAFCGPAAAISFAQQFGRNPTADEARQLAVSVGWTPNQGMAGVDSERALLGKMGISTKLERGVDWNHVTQDALNGNPVILDTPGHYYFVDGAQQNQDGTTQYHVGQSGLALRGGAEWMTRDQMQNMAAAGTVRAALYADNPQSPHPSVATPASATQTTAGLSGGGGLSGQVGDRGQQILSAGAQAASWLGDQGQKALQAVMVTEGGLNNARGDNGQSVGPLQFYAGGQLANLAQQMGMGIDAAKTWVEQNPVAAVQWAIGTPDRPGYLGAAIQRGLQQGLSGADLATYAQRTGQVSVSPERAGQNFQAMFGGGQNVIAGAAGAAGNVFSNLAQTGGQLAQQGQNLITNLTQPLGESPTAPIEREANQRMASLQDTLNATLQQNQQAQDQRSVQASAIGGGLAGRSAVNVTDTGGGGTPEQIAGGQTTAQAEPPKPLWQSIGDTIGSAISQGLQPLVQAFQGSPTPAPEGGGYGTVPAGGVNPLEGIAPPQPEPQPVGAPIIPPEGGGYGAGGPLQPGEVAQAVAPITTGVQGFQNEWQRAAEANAAGQDPLLQPLRSAVSAVLAPLANTWQQAAEANAANPQIQNMIVSSGPSAINPYRDIVQEGIPSIIQGAQQGDVGQVLRGALQVVGGVGAGLPGGEGEVASKGLTSTLEAIDRLNPPPVARAATFEGGEMAAQRGQLPLGAEFGQELPTGGPRPVSTGEIPTGRQPGQGALPTMEPGSPFEREQFQQAIANAPDPVRRVAEQIGATEEPSRAFDLNALADMRQQYQAAQPPLVNVPARVTPIDRFIGYTVASMLSRASTMAHITVSQALQTVGRPVVEAAAGHPLEAERDIAAMAGSISDAFAAFGRTMQTGLRQGQTVPSPAVAAPLGLPLRYHSAVSEFFRVLNSAGASAAEASRLLREDPSLSFQDVLQRYPQQIVDAGTDAAARASFVRGGGFAGTAGQWIGQQRNALMQSADASQRALGYILESVVPISHLPGVILGEGIRGLPGVNEARGIQRAVELARGTPQQTLASGQVLPAVAGSHYAAQQELAMTALRTFRNFAILSEVSQGNITGDGPSDPAARARLMEAVDKDGNAVWRPNSVRIGGRWFDYTGLGPIHLAMSSIANAVETATEWAQKPPEKRGDLPELAQEMGARELKTIGNAWYLKGLADLLSGIKEGTLAKGAGTTISSVADRLVPASGLLDEIRGMTDPYAREPQNILEREASRIPGLSTLVQPRLETTTGKPEEQPHDILSTILRGTPPGMMTPNPVAAEIDRLTQGGNSVSVTSNVKTYAGAQQTPQQQRLIQEQLGQATNLYVLNTMNQPAYAKLSDAQKADALKKAVGQADSLAKITLGSQVARSPHESALLQFAQMPQFSGINSRLSPDQIARANWEIENAKSKLAEYTKQYKGAAENRLQRDDPVAYRLSQRDRLDKEVLDRMRARIDKATGGALSRTDQQAAAGGLVGAGSTVVNP